MSFAESCRPCARPDVQAYSDLACASCRDRRPVNSLDQRRHPGTTLQQDLMECFAALLRQLSPTLLPVGQRDVRHLPGMIWRAA